MDHSYVTLPLDSSNCFSKHKATFRTKLATPIELEPDKREVEVVEISYPKGYKKRLLYYTLRLD